MKAKEATDHLGQSYPSISAMCRAWGVSTALYYARLQRGKTLEEALGPYDPALDKRTKACTDHLGQEFPSKKEMCEAWGLRVGTFEKRLKSGFTLEEALTRDPSIKGVTPTPVTDHTGQKFPSVKAMCERWGIKPDMYYNRLRIGWSLEDTLTTEVWGQRKSQTKVESGEEKGGGAKGQERSLEEEKGEERAPGELKSAAGKPKPKVAESWAPDADARVCGVSAAARMAGAAPSRDVGRGKSA